MAKKFLVSIDLNSNELQNAVIQNLATAPASPSEGQIYYDSSVGDKSIYFYNGSSWVDIGGDLRSISAGDAIAISGTRDVTVDVLYDDVTIGVNGSNQVYVKDGGISNAKLANSSLTVTAGNGLTGGGSISLGSSATINVGAGVGIVVNADSISLDYAGTDNFIDSATNLEGTAISTGDTIIYHDATDDTVKKGLVSDLPFSSTTGTVTSVAIAGTDGIDVDSGSPITSAGTITLGLSNVPNSSLANSSVTVTAGAGLANGGTVSLGGSTTLNVGAGTGITVNANDVEITGASSLTTNNVAKWNGTGFADSSIIDDGTTVTITNNLDVQGTITYIDSTTVQFGDNILLLAKDQTAPSLDAGFEVERGSSANVSFLWVEASQYFSTVNQAFHIGSVASAGAGYSGNEYLVSDSGVVKYVTSSELADDVAGGFTFTEGNGIDITGSGTSSVTIAAESASTTNQGVVELATQTEARALSSTTLAVTPNALQGLRYAATGPGTSSTSFIATHNLGSLDVIVQVYDVATNATVECDVVRTDSNNVTLSFATAQGANSLRILVIKIA